MHHDQSESDSEGEDPPGDILTCADHPCCVLFILVTVVTTLTLWNCTNSTIFLHCKNWYGHHWLLNINLIATHQLSWMGLFFLLISAFEIFFWKHHLTFNVNNDFNRICLQNAIPTTGCQDFSRPKWTWLNQPLAREKVYKTIKQSCLMVPGSVAVKNILFPSLNQDIFFVWRLSQDIFLIGWKHTCLKIKAHLVVLTCIVKIYHAIPVLVCLKWMPAESTSQLIHPGWIG